MRQIPEIGAAGVAFGDIQHMPKYEDVPNEFKNMSNKWNSLFNSLFFRGAESLELTPKAGVDKEKALKAIQSIMVSFKPKHEHKEAACAYLFSEWFEDYSLIEKARK